MNNLKEFYEARDTIQEIIRADLLGPMTEEPEEIINVKYPTTYYIVGKLYPVSTNTQMVLLHDEAEELTEVKKTDDVLLESKYGKRKNDEDSEDDDEISGCNILNPSAMGITFAVKKDTQKIKVILDYALYKPITAEEAKIQNPDIGYSSTDSLWKRYPAKFESDLILEKTKFTPIVISDGKTPIGEIVLIRHKSAKNEKDVIRYTLSLKNIQEKEEQKPIDEAQKTIFQPRIKIFVPGGHFVEVKRYLKLNKIRKEDEKSKDFDDNLVMDLLYSKVKSYAQGHGCAVSWEEGETGNVTSIQTEFLPEEQILQMRPVNLKDLQEYCKDITFNNKLFSTAYLKDASKEDITIGIEQLCNVYQRWIDKQREQISNLEDRERFEDVATNNLDLCEKSLERIRNSAKIIANDNDIYKAFRYANEAIFEQNRHKEWVAIKENNPKLKINEVDKDFEWRPFQLAFILQELESIANPSSKDRNLTDLLWFPTGGGKTEAYLGLAAFTIFLRRLKYPEDNKGVTVLTRYTYRLLTFQQFERTLRLICACEQIRKNKNIPGKRISIGMWIGEKNTPNNVKDAYSIIKSLQQEEKTSSIKTSARSNSQQENTFTNGNPKQITKCPWCGQDLTAQDYSFDSDRVGDVKTKDPERMFIHCSNPECEYNKNKNKEGIPAIVIDEQIYSETPTFVVATVDKFAQIPLKAKAGAIFGYLENGNRLLPPELIIQDELHLLTGPLGTITGIYEAGFKKLCELNGHYPKVISSTATVKNAKSQIKSLYGGEYSQFPAQGLDITDSFFAKQSKEDENPGRMYMGCMAVGTTPITMMVRVMAILYFATRYISTCKKYSPEVIDSFYTMTGYFNTLRELGGAIIRATDDVDARVKILCKKYEKKYPWIKDDSVKSPEELTSRVPSSDIGKILRKISENKYNTNECETNAEDYLFATNMISVGVDIDRLGTMIVVGQPKMTAEYIQSTSRVGRKNPGLVITTYNQKKSRDRSHFEQFKQYHKSFYKFVEATSITPFSDRARNRVLHTIYIMLCRYLIPELRNDNAAFKYVDKDLFKNSIDNIKKYILETVNKIDKDEKNNVEKELEIIDSEWLNKAKDEKELAYNGKHGLFEQDTNEDSRFRVMNNMRSVEKSAKAKLYT